MEDNLKSFLAENAIKSETVGYVASERFVDAEKKPIEWKFRILTSEESSQIVQRCKVKSFIPGTKDYKVETDNEKVGAELAIATIVYPNLNDANLQNSYGAVGAEDVLKKMLIPGEYADLITAVQEAQGFKVGMQDKIKRAKN